MGTGGASIMVARTATFAFFTLRAAATFTGSEHAFATEAELRTLAAAMQSMLFS